MHRRIRTIFIVLSLFVISLNLCVNTYQVSAAIKSLSTERAELPKLYKKKEKLIAAIRQGLLDRKAKIELRIPNTKEFENITGMIENAVAFDDEATAKDADYLMHSLAGWTYKTSYVVGGSTKTLTILPKYLTTMKEEKELDKKVSSVLKSLKLAEASDYEKVKAIHDYIINRVDYDTSLTKESAYQALIKKSSVCSGYAQLAYRMFTEAGLESRIITGSAKGVPHAWNIVKVDGKWYNIDLTWDDPITSDGSRVLVYNYFLKNDEDFSDHIRDKKYRTKEFLKQYPIAEASYKVKPMTTEKK